VSSGPFESLNLGILTEDDPADVTANRLLLADALGIEPNRRWAARTTAPVSPIATASHCYFAHPATARGRRSVERPRRPALLWWPIACRSPSPVKVAS
jgi:hypothetical protein